LSKLIQYRCCRCKTLLFKYTVGNERLKELGRYAFFKDYKDGLKNVSCRKCQTEQYICGEELREVDAVEV
jgi:hypothetical protein